MKKFCLITAICLFGCKSSRPLVSDAAVLNQHPKPIKIFGIGNWKPGYSVLTLVDASNNYFIIITKANDTLRKEAIYNNY